METLSTRGLSASISSRMRRLSRRYFSMSGLMTDGARAKLQRPRHRHGRAHAVAPGDVAGGEHHAALAAADDQRLVDQIRMVALLHRGVEGVAIDMGNGQGGELGMGNDPRRAAAAAGAGRRLGLGYGMGQRPAVAA